MKGDKMKFKSEKVNHENMFAIGKDLVRDEYIMAITVCGIAWYDHYFSISQKEFELYDEERDEFMKIYYHCMRSGSGSYRFLCSDKINENVQSQLERLREGNSI